MKGQKRQERGRRGGECWWLMATTIQLSVLMSHDQPTIQIHFCGPLNIFFCFLISWNAWIIINLNFVSFSNIIVVLCNFLFCHKKIPAWKITILLLRFKRFFFLSCTSWDTTSVSIFINPDFFKRLFITSVCICYFF